jgi:hypothetical protein
MPIGQTGCTFKTPKYAQHILDTGHEYNTTKETMQVSYIKKGKLLNTPECFHLNNLSRQKLQIYTHHNNTY